MLLKLLKFIIALALVPFVAAEAWTIYDLALHGVTTNDWYQSWFLAFSAGLGAWFLIYFLLPRTMWLYVLGHELTHALAAQLAGGKISAFQVSAKGGHVITDKVNWWITLSPYFIPLYVLIWMALWISVDFYYPLKPYVPVLYFGIGLFWCFHLTFTVSMIRLGQTDISSQGWLFSIVIILMVNLIFFLLLFSFLAHDQTFSASWHLFLHRTGQSYLWTANEIQAGAIYLWSFAK